MRERRRERVRALREGEGVSGRGSGVAHGSCLAGLVSACVMD